jgi:hypothetical protein
VTVLQAAAATVEVTPPPGTPLAGYGARGEAVATGRHDPLEAGLLWLSDRDADSDLVWVTLDVVGVDVELSRALRAAVTEAIARPEAQVLLCASHTHSSAAHWFRRPTPQPAFGPENDEVSAGMRAELISRIAAAAGELPSRLRPVRLVAAEGTVRGVGGNRHRPDGPHDPSVGVLAAVGEDGDVLAVLLNYASHPTVLGHDNVFWSADWPGSARRALAAALGRLRPFGDPGHGGPVHEPAVLFLQGAAGDSSARFVRRSQSFAEADRLGGLLAGQALTALLAGAEEIPDGRLLARRGTVTLETHSGNSVEQARKDEAVARSAWEATRLDHSDGSPEERIARTRHEGTVVALRMAETGLPPTVELPLTVVTLGGYAWVHLPVELFASIGLRIREASPFSATRVVGYTDGYFGYVPDRAAYRDGVYESAASLFGPDAGDRLHDAALALLREVATDLGAVAAGGTR